MPQRADTDDYRSLFLGDVPIMDMRAPTEFTQGAFPCARSLPLLNDDERAQVGTCFKQQGQAAAITLGHQLVAGETKAQRLAGWREFTKTHSNGYVYCFRGGLRSQTVQQWLRDAGVDYPLIRGGYKAMRRFLIDELSRSVECANFVLIGGKTGTGKTRVITALDSSIDLEGLANHRGSTFGQLPPGQPSQIDFENTISIALLKLLSNSTRSIFLEDEGRLIGRLHLPDELHAKMATAPMVVVEQSIEERVDVVVGDYVLDLGRRYRALHPTEGDAIHAAKLQDDLARIRKRLGSERHGQMSELMAEAFVAQQATGDLSLHREWIAFLLEKYYDPMYDYQLEQREGSLLFHGDREAVLQWVRTQS